MTFVITPYVLISAFAAVIAAMVAVLAWQRRTVPGGSPLVALMVAVCCWSTAAALEYAAIRVSAKILWSTVSYIGIITCPVFFLLFALEYSQLDRWLTRRTIALLFVVPLLTMILVATNGWHGLIWPTVTMTGTPEDNLALYGHGVGFWLGAVGYSYLLMLVGTGLLVRSALRVAVFYRRQAIMLVIAALAPWLVNALYNAELSPLPGLEMTPLVLAFSGSIFAWDIFRYRLLDLTPVARETLIETMVDGMVVLDVQDRVVDINPAAQQLLAVKAAQAIGLTAGALFAHWLDWAERIGDAQTAQVEIPVQLPTPRDLELAVSPIFDRHARFTGRLLILRDITDRKWTQASLSALQQTTLELIAQLDLPRLLENIVSRAGQLMGTSSGFIDLVDPASGRLRPQVGAGVLAESLALEAQPGEGVAGVVWQTGKPLVVDDYDAWVGRMTEFSRGALRAVVGVPLLIGTEVVGVLGLGYPAGTNQVFTPDAVARLTQFALAAIAIENARLYTQAETARHAAEVAARAKSDFLASMSHELRTPLNAILGFSELMSHDPGLPPGQQDNLAIIKRSGEQLLGLINDVLELAKVEAGRLVLHEAPFDLHQLLLEVGELLRLRAAAKGLVLTVTITAAVPRYVTADAGKLRQILINLIGNAVKFTVAGSVELQVSALAGGVTPRLAFAIRDTGPGIAPADLATIFEPFVQGASGQGAREGTGLGLAISREFAQCMGGELTAVSSGVAGEGSLFRLEIPVAVPAAAQATSTGATVQTALLPPAPVGVLPDNSAGERAFAASALPPGWVEPLRQAALAADVEALDRLAAEIDRAQPALATALRAWIGGYDYSAILTALPAAEPSQPV